MGYLDFLLPETLTRCPMRWCQRRPVGSHNFYLCQTVSRLHLPMVSVDTYLWCQWRPQEEPGLSPHLGVMRFSTDCHWHKSEAGGLLVDTGQGWEFSILLSNNESSDSPLSLLWHQPRRELLGGNDKLCVYNLITGAAT